MARRCGGIPLLSRVVTLMANGCPGPGGAWFPTLSTGSASTVQGVDAAVTRENFCQRYMLGESLRHRGRERRGHPHDAQSGSARVEAVAVAALAPDPHDTLPTDDPPTLSVGLREVSQRSEAVVEGRVAAPEGAPLPAVRREAHHPVVGAVVLGHEARAPGEPTKLRGAVERQRRAHRGPARVEGEAASPAALRVPAHTRGAKQVRDDRERDHPALAELGGADGGDDAALPELVLRVVDDHVLRRVLDLGHGASYRGDPTRPRPNVDFPSLASPSGARADASSSRPTPRSGGCTPGTAAARCRNAVGSARGYSPGVSFLDRPPVDDEAALDLVRGDGSRVERPRVRDRVALAVGAELAARGPAHLPDHLHSPLHRPKIRVFPKLVTSPQATADAYPSR